MPQPISLKDVMDITGFSSEIVQMMTDPKKPNTVSLQQLYDQFAKVQETDKLRERLAKAETTIEALEAAGPPVTVKMSEKGAISMYGVGRFPVSLYKRQWEKLIANIHTVTDFIEEQDPETWVKQDANKAAAKQAKAAAAAAAAPPTAAAPTAAA